MIKDEILAYLRRNFKGKQVEFTGDSMSMISLHDMVYDGKEWFCITGRATIDIMNPNLPRVKRDLSVSFNQAFDQHVSGRVVTND